MPSDPSSPGSVEQTYMALAIELAQRARGRTAPNPMVGSVVVRQGRIVGMGHHVRAGSPHAEVVALRRAGSQAVAADLYVTLEPCHHTGRTGPCAQAVVEAKVRRVIIGTRDPNPRVNGRGIRALRRSGLQVVVGVLRQQCTELNEAFNHAVVAKRAFVVAKLAQSLDGCVATATGLSQWITQPSARKAGHQLRNELDAIVVGSGTVLADNPRLTCRVPRGRDPLRVVLDGRGRTPPSAAVVQAAATSCAPTLICVGAEASARRCTTLAQQGAQIWVCPEQEGRLSLEAMLRELYARGILSVLVEGGPTVQGAFFDAHLVDRLVAYVAPMVLGGTGARHAVAGRGCTDLGGAARLLRPTLKRIGADFEVSGRVVY